jgi:hypothetical protein
MSVGRVSAQNSSKALAGNLNNSNLFIQFLRYWEQIEQLLRAEHENTEAVGKGVDAGADSDNEVVNVDESSGTKEAGSRSKSMHASDLGPQCPLFSMILHRSSLHHTASSTGGTSRGVIKRKAHVQSLALASNRRRLPPSSELIGRRAVKVCICLPTLVTQYSFAQ